MSFTPAINFSVYDYTDTETLSTFTLDLTPVKCFTDYSSVTASGAGIKQIIWDFGDGETLRNSLTATHTYKFPGEYNIRLFVYDENGTGALNSVTKNLTAYNYVPDQIQLSATGVGPIQLSASTPNTPIEVIRYNSWQTVPYIDDYTINLSVSGSNSFFSFDEYLDDKWAHLKPYSRFLSFVTNSENIVLPETVVNLVTTSTDIFVKRDGNNIVRSSPNAVGAEFAGTSGSQTIYFVDDTSSSQVNLFAQFDLTKFFTSNEEEEYVTENILPFLNAIPNTLSVSVTSLTGTQLKISSNGMDDNSLFNIFPIKFVNTKIANVVRIVNGEGYPVKRYELLSVDSIGVVNTTDNSAVSATYYSCTSAVENESGLGGYQYGYFIVHEPCETCAITANVDIVDSGETLSLSGQSTTFAVHPVSGQYNVVKRNENIDLYNIYKQHSLQEVLYDSYNLQEHILKPIIGDISSEETSIGKHIYEKIANFTRNTTSFDFANLEHLIDLLHMLKIEYETRSIVFPAKLKRIMDICSINRSKLWGAMNKFDEDFYNRGTQTRTSFGKNIGDELDIETAILTSMSPIVAREKFSNVYRLVNSMSLTGGDVTFFDSLSTTFPLSGYNTTWNWPLAVPAGISLADLKGYYEFYEYIPGHDNTQIDGMIVWIANRNTLTQNLTGQDWYGDSGAIVSLISQTLYEGLGL